MSQPHPAQPGNAATGPPRGLPRLLGASQATAIVVGAIIGSGIFLVPREMMQDVGSSELVYLAWIVGGILKAAGNFPAPTESQPTRNKPGWIRRF
jgi:hypothetical protein